LLCVNVTPNDEGNFSNYHKFRIKFRLGINKDSVIFISLWVAGNPDNIMF